MSAEPAPPTGGLPPLRDLPEPVRGRVVALTARVLPDVARVPPALRKVADFAPARRARHGRSAISAALEADEEFRDHVAVQVAAIPDDDNGPTERAARAWLVRPEGARDALEAALDEVASLSATDVATTAQVDALTERVAALQQAERDDRARHRAALQKLKDDNADLRRKLGETRSAERSARERADRLADDSSAALDAAGAATAAAEAEARRLRARVEELRATVMSRLAVVFQKREQFDGRRIFLPLP